MFFTTQYLTTRKLNEYFDLVQKKEMTKDLLSEQLRTVQDQGSKATHTLKRNKRFIQISEKELWKEYYYLPNGKVKGSDAERILTEKYPDIFQTAKKDKKLANEIYKKEMEVFGFHAKELTMANMLKLVAMFSEYNRIQRRLHNRIINWFKLIKYYLEVRKQEIHKKQIPNEPNKSAKENYYDKKAKGELQHQKAKKDSKNA